MKKYYSRQKILCFLQAVGIDIKQDTKNLFVVRRHSCHKIDRACGVKIKNTILTFMCRLRLHIIIAECGIRSNENTIVILWVTDCVETLFLKTSQGVWKSIN
jgi:hypothetical protein